MLEAKLSSLWGEIEKLRAQMQVLPASGRNEGSNAAGFDRMKVTEMLNGNKNLAGADLTGLDLSSLDFSGASLKGATLTDAELTKAILTNVDAEGADFARANVAGASLTKMNLRGAGFAVRGLASAEFDNLRGAILAGLDVAAVDLRGKSVENANFANVVNLGKVKSAGTDLVKAQIKAAGCTLPQMKQLG